MTNQNCISLTTSGPRVSQQIPKSILKLGQDLQSQTKEDQILPDEVQSAQQAAPIRPESKTFEGIPRNWHQTIKVRNHETMRVKLYFRCRHRGCGSIFKKSCNLRDHFRKHTGQRPFTCPKCKKTFTQSGNLGRHLKNVHSIPKESISFYKRQAKNYKSDARCKHGSGSFDFADCDELVEISDESNDEGSLVLMTCEEFEKRYPNITAEELDEAILKKPAKPDLKVRNSSRLIKKPDQSETLQKRLKKSQNSGKYSN